MTVQLKVEGLFSNRTMYTFFLIRDIEPDLSGLLRDKLVNVYLTFK